MFKLLSDLELEALSDIELQDMIMKLSKAIAETKSMQDKESDGQKLYHSLEAERERRKGIVDVTKGTSG